MLLGTVGALSCAKRSSNDRRSTGSSNIPDAKPGLLARLIHPNLPRPANPRLQPLAVPADTIGATETDGVGVTDALGPEPQVTVTPKGTLSAHIPLWVPPGRAGMTPELSLEYNSGGTAWNGVGRLDGGWKLAGIPLIHRCNRSAADSMTDSSSSIQTSDGDQLCVDGEPLVPEVAGSTMALNVAYRRLNDNHQRFVITAVDAAGVKQITAYDNSGRVMTFGLNPDNTSGAGGAAGGYRYSFNTVPGKHDGGILDGIQASKSTDWVRYGWFLQHTEDRNGNSIDYYYQQYQACQDATGFVPPLGANWQIFYIKYTSNPTTGLASSKTVLFDDGAEGSCGVFSGHFVNGQLYALPPPINKMSVYAPDTSGNSALIRQYNFTYGNTSPTATLPAYSAQRMLTQLTDCDGAGVCRPPLTFAYDEGTPLDLEWADVTYPNTQIQVLVEPWVLGEGFRPHIYLPDINVDGRADLLYMVNNTNHVNNVYSYQLATGTLGAPALAAPVTTGLSLPYDPTIVTGQARLQPVDFDGRGYPIFLFGTSDTGSNFFATDYLGNISQVTVNGSSQLLGTTAGEMLDIDGNGLPDLVESQSDVYLNGEIANPSMNWDYRKNNGAGALTVGGYLPIGPNDHLIVDVDGDGSAEYLTQSSNSDTSRYSVIHAGVSPINGTAPISTLTVPGATTQVSGPYLFADINGDGLTDAIQLPGDINDATLYVRFNSGNGFFYPSPWVNPLHLSCGSDYTARVIDFNNDGRQDIIFRARANYGLQPSQSLYVVWFDGNQLNATLLPIQSRLNPDIEHSPSEANLFEIGDVNGDGLDDIVMVNDFQNVVPPGGGTATAPATGTLHVYYRLPSARKNRVLTSIDRKGGTRAGITIPGEEYDIKYAPIIDSSVYTDLTPGRRIPAASYPWSYVEGKLWAVNEIRRLSDEKPAGVLLNDTIYTYYGARRDMRGRGFLGYSSITSNQVDKGITTLTQYDLTAKEGIKSFYPFAGLPVQIITTTTTQDPSKNSVVWQKTVTNHYTTVHTTNMSYFAYPDTTTENVTESNSSGSFATLYSNTSSRVFDSRGTLMSMTTTRDDGSLDGISHAPTYSDDGTWPRIASDTIAESSGTTAAGTLTRQSTLTLDSKWNLSSITSLPTGGNNRGELPLNVTYAPTAEGLPSSVTYESTGDNKTRTLTYRYDTPDKDFATVVFDALGHIRRYAVHPGYGLTAISEDENGLQTVFKYDGLGRKRFVSHPNGESESYSYVPAASDALKTTDPKVAVAVKLTTANSAQELFQIDWRGHTTMHQRLHRADGLVEYDSKVYDSEDRITDTYGPSFSVSGGRHSAWSYDTLDRQLTELRADGTSWNYGYQGLVTTAFDVAAPKNVRQTTMDSRGRVTQTSELLIARVIQNVMTKYAYGPFGSTYSITHPDGSVVYQEVNRLGRLWHLRDPDAGERYYSYNAFGQVMFEQTPTYYVSYEYDTLGRRTEADAVTNGVVGTRTTTWTYDTAANGLGLLASTTSPDQVTKTFGYDAQSRVNSEKWTVGGQTYEIDHSYNTTGQLASVTYPAPPGQSAPVQVKYVYDSARGDLSKITNATQTTVYWQWLNSDATGQFYSEKLGNGVEEIRTESLSRPTTIGNISVIAGFASATPTTLRNVTYTTDDDHNLIGRSDSISGSVEAFGYDTLDRLTSWQWSSGGVLKQSVSYDYDSSNNLLDRNVLVGGGVSTTFNYESTTSPHLLTSTTVGGITTANSYGYDGNGRQTLSPGRTTTYHELELPATVGANIDNYTFAYDADRLRVLKTRNSTDNTVTLGDLYERRQIGSQPTTAYYTVQAPDGPVAILKASSGVSTLDAYYLHKGHLGSVELITNVNGSVVDRPTYEPFGQRIAAMPPQQQAGQPSSGIDIGFDGLRHDDETTLGLIDMRGRMYDPAQARFLTPDPLGPGRGAVFLNPFVYVGNNPLHYRDPSGFDPDDPAEELSTLLGIVVPGWASMPVFIGDTVHGTGERYDGRVEGPAAISTGGIFNRIQDRLDQTNWIPGTQKATNLIAGVGDGLFPLAGHLRNMLGLGDSIDKSKLYWSGRILGIVGRTILLRSAAAAEAGEGADDAIDITRDHTVIGDEPPVADPPADPSGGMDPTPEADPTSPPEPIHQGFSDDAASTAYDGMRGGGGHAIRHLMDEGLIKNAGSLKSRVEAFKTLTAPILQHPSTTFVWRLGNTPARGFAGTAAGQHVVVFVATEGEYQGIIVGAIVPDANQMARWGIK